MGDVWCGGQLHTQATGPGPKIRPQPGRWQRPAARQRRRAVGDGDGDLAGCGQELAGVGVDGLDGDLVAEAFEAADVAAGAAADVLASFVVVGAEVGIDGVGIGEQGVADDQLGPADGALGFFLGICLHSRRYLAPGKVWVRPALTAASPRAPAVWGLPRPV